MGTVSVFRGVGFGVLLGVCVWSGEALATGSSGPRCQQRDATVVTEFDTLLAGIRAGTGPVYRSVESFIAALPMSLRQSAIFMTTSRSLQGATVTNPRVVLKSPNSDITLSFNTDPNQPGYDRVEIARWNGATAQVEMSEIRFPADSTTPSVSSRSRPQFINDPSECRACHQSPSTGGTRHVWDTYRFWPGQLPFAEDALHRGSVEVDNYRAIMTRVEAGTGRLGQLRPLETMAQIDAALTSTGRYQLRSTVGETTQTPNTPALDLSHQLLKTNGCRIGWELADRADWEQIKYAATGALMGCTNPTEFLDAGGNARAADYFRSRGIGMSGGAFDYNALLADTQRRQRSLAVDKEGRQLWNFERQFQPATDSYARAVREMDLVNSSMVNNQGSFTSPGQRFASFEDSAPQNTLARYLLEPAGVPVDLWSMSPDPGSYGHNQFFDEICQSPPVLAVLRTMPGISDDAGARAACRNGASLPSVCTELANRSRPLMRIPAVSASASTSATRFECETPEIVAARALQPIADVERALVRYRVSRVFSQNCAMCHSPGIDGAPTIPFNNINQLETYLRMTRGRVGDLGERIFDRIARHPDSYGAMPEGMGSLAMDQKVDIRRWLNSLPTNAP